MRSAYYRNGYRNGHMFRTRRRLTKRQTTPIHDATMIMRSLVESGVIPARLFEMYVKKPEGVTEQ